MNPTFPFDAEKITEAAALFIQLDGGRIEVLKLMKLIYLSEREGFRKRGVPIYGGRYYSLPHGPIISEGLALIDGQGMQNDQAVWDRSISSRDGNWLSLVGDGETGSLSVSEIKMIKGVHAEHGEKSAWELRNWCHENLPEYEEIEKGRIPITLKEIGLAVKTSPFLITEEAATQNFLHNVFAS